MIRSRRLDQSLDGHPPLSPGERLALLCGLAVVTVSVVVVAEHRMPDGPPKPAPEAQCSSEDETMVELVEPAYGMAAGTLHCVHIDALVP